MDERQRLVRVARSYYLEGQTMESIAHLHGVSRPTVSRWLTQAREAGIVRIEVDATGATAPLGERIGARYGIRVHLVETTTAWSEVRRLDAVARAAARLVDSWMIDRTVLGLAWGTTVSTLVGYLPRRPLHDVVVVQMNGDFNTMTSGRMLASELLSEAAHAYEGRYLTLPAPAFFDRAATREVLWEESSIRTVLAMRAEADIAVFGVGSLTGPVRSQVYAGGFVAPDELRRLHADGVVGDICTHFLREDGSHLDLALNDRASGPSPSELARIPRRLCVVAGEHRVPATLGALRTGAVTDLVIDDRTASALLDRTGHVD